MIKQNKDLVFRRICKGYNGIHNSKEELQDRKVKYIGDNKIILEFNKGGFYRGMKPANIVIYLERYQNKLEENIKKVHIESIEVLNPDLDNPRDVLESPLLKKVLETILDDFSKI